MWLGRVKDSRVVSFNNKFGLGKGLTKLRDGCHLPEARFCSNVR